MTRREFYLKQNLRPEYKEKLKKLLTDVSEEDFQTLYNIDKLYVGTKADKIELEPYQDVYVYNRKNPFSDNVNKDLITQLRWYVFGSDMNLSFTQEGIKIEAYRSIGD